MDVVNWISVITGIVSIVLAVVSLILSFVFYRWSDKSNKEMSEMSQSISEKTDYLGKLFDKMIDTTFSMVKDDSEAMRHHLFNNADVGSVSTQNGDNSIDIYVFIKQTDKRTKKEIMEHFSMSEERIEPVLDKLSSTGLIYMKNGAYLCPEYMNNVHNVNYKEIDDSSDD